MNILPGIGLDTLRFGTFRDQVIEQLGQPDLVEEHPADEDGGEWASWSYGAARLELRFEAEENWRLVSLSTDSEAIRLFGTAVIDLEPSAIAALIAEHAPGWRCEVDGFEVWVEALGLQLWLDDGRVSGASWSCLFTDDDELAWPAIH